MKKLISILLIAVLMFSCVPFASAASKTSCEYDATQNFVNALEKNKIKYSYEGMDKDDNEWVEIVYEDDDFDTITVNVFFQKNGTVCYRIWNVVDFSSGLNFAYKVCNDLNAAYKYAKFVIDTSDNSLTVENDMELTAEADCGEACVEMMRDLLGIIDEARDTILTLK